jgi:CRP/FNR family transcriptional regulator
MLTDHFPALGPLGDRLAAETQAVTLEPGAFICMDGGVCEHLALVTDGRARVYKASDEGREITLYRVAPGESCILTASCILSDRRFPAFAVADTAVTARLVPAAVVRRWMHEAPAWRRYVFDLLAGRLGAVIATLEEVAFRRLDTRLARLLLDAADRHAADRHAAGDADGDAGAAPAVVRTTHERLAADLGSAREVVSRLLKDFEHDGLVALARGRVRLLDRDGLRRAADA